MKILPFGSLLLVAGLTSSTALATDVRMSMTGFGQFRIGMTEETLGKLVGNAIDPPADEDEAACRYVSPDKLSAGIGFMLLDGRLARLDVDTPGIPTLSGASVGDTEAEVVSLYGPTLNVSNHFYTGPDGKYLTLFSKDGKYGIRFETDGGIVTRYYVGTAQAIQFVEGCQ